MTIQDRTITATLDVEISLLGALLLNSAQFDDAQEILTPEDFYRVAHKLIFGAMVQLASEGRPIDPITVNHALTLAELEEVGKGYAIQITNGVPHGMNIAEYARLVREYAIRRALEAHGHAMIRGAQLGDENAEDLLANAERTLDQLRGRAVRTDVQDAKARANATFQHLEAITSGNGIQGVTTGLRELDNDLRGLHPGNLILIGARPSQGKSCLGLTMAMAAAQATQIPALFISLEMSAQDLNLREVAMRAQVDGWRLTHGKLGEAQYPRVVEALENMRSGLVHVVDAPALTVPQIRILARRARLSTGLSVVVVDYLQYVKDERNDGENRTLALGEISRGLKVLARELDIPVVALSQLNRKSDERPDKRPHLADLRESGSLEQDADVVLLLYRPYLYFPDKYPSDFAEIIIAKQRNGPTGTVEVRFIAEQTRFTDKEAA